MSACWKISFTTQKLEAAEAALEEFGATIWATRKTANGTLFEIYMEQKPDMAALALPDDARPESVHIPPHDWVSESQQNLPPVRVSPYYLHGSHDAPMRGSWRNIEMQAGLAFGSGHHGTTQGCLFLYADLVKRMRPYYVADIGCGSGALAIAAAKTGAEHVFASDKDPIATHVTRANAHLNGVSPHISSFVAGGMQHRYYLGRKFDVIFANILARPLIALAGDFEAHLARGGRLILSGLMTTQARRVSARYRGLGLVVEARKIIGPWTSLCLKR